MKFYTEERLSKILTRIGFIRSKQVWYLWLRQKDDMVAHVGGPDMERLAVVFMPRYIDKAKEVFYSRLNKGR